MLAAMGKNSGPCFLAALILCSSVALAEEPPGGQDPTADQNPAAQTQTDNPADRDQAPAAETSNNPGTRLQFQEYKTSLQKRNESFQRLYGEEADRKFRVILELISEKNLESAGRKLEEFLILYPDHSMTPRARQELAAIRDQQGRPSASLYRYEQSTVLDRPSQEEASSLLEMARIHIRQGRFQPARSILQDIQERFRGTDEARQARLLERSYRFMEQPENASPSSIRSQQTDRESEAGREVESDRSTEGPRDREENRNPLFPMQDQENGREPGPDDSGIDNAGAEPSTGQRVLDRMGEGIERLDSDSMQPLEPLEGD